VTSTQVRLILLIAALTSLSNFYRASNAVIAPDLMTELGLSPTMLGLANGAFFLALGLAQIPLGIALDRFGPRLAVTVLTGVAVAGSLLHAVAVDGAGLIASRLLLGFGCSASFMSAIVLTGRWFSPDRFGTVYSWITATANIGMVMASAPLAFASEAVGWRSVFYGTALLSALVGVLFFTYVRDAPPGHAILTQRTPERLTEAFRGLMDVWRMRGIWPLFALFLVAYSVPFAIVGLWSGPYLHDVHGLGGVDRGNILLAMAIANIASILCYGPLDRVFNSRKKVVTLGLCLTTACLVLLAVIERPSLPLAAGLLILLCAVSGFSIMCQTHGRSLFPENMVGRGVTTLNMAQVGGAFAMPVLTGMLVDWITPTGGTPPEAAYRLIFAFLAAALLLGLLAYRRVPDTRPRG
jgi:MFS family permease